MAVLALFAFVGCGGESEQEKAEKAACEGKAEINEGLTALRGITLSASTVTAAQDDFAKVTAGVKKLKENAPKLAAPRKEEVEKAATTLSAEIQTIVGDLAKISLSEASAKFAGAVQKFTMTVQSSHERPSLLDLIAATRERGRRPWPAASGVSQEVRRRFPAPAGA